MSVDPARANERRETRLYPIPTTRPVVFLGDSLTEQINWRELLGNKRLVLNRGIGGDTSEGVLRRLNSITSLHPQAIFLMIGTNDGQLLGFAPDDTASRIARIVEKIHVAEPDCKVYVQSIIPSRTPKFVTWGKRLNDLLKGMKGIEFVDIRPAFEESPGGLLRAELTWDGLHLTASAYDAWAEKIQPLLESLPNPECGGY